MEECHHSAGCQPLLSVVPPRAVGIGVEKGLHTLLCLLAYAGESPVYPASAVTACGGGGEVVLQPLRKLVVSILSFAAAALFFPLPTPLPTPCASGMVCLNHILQNQFSKQIRWVAETDMQSGKNVHSSLHFVQRLDQ